MGERDCATGWPMMQARGIFWPVIFWWSCQSRNRRTGGRQRAARSRGEAAVRAQKGEQRQERQTQNGEMVALDLLEQLHPGALELIAADARRHRLAGRIEIAVEEIVGQSPHGEAGPVDVVEQ